MCGALAGAALALAVAGGARAAGCPKSEDLWKAGKFKAAEDEARACLKAAPDDVSVWLALSKALAVQAKYAAALKWAEKAIARYPADLDLVSWRIRVLAWKGDMAKAWTEIEKLPPEAFDDKETALLAGNVALWKKDYKEAVTLYSYYLKLEPNDLDAIKNRGIAYEKSYKIGEARKDYERLCEKSGKKPDSCKYLESLNERFARAKLALVPSYWLIEKQEDDFNVLTSVDVRAWRQLHFGVSLDIRGRHIEDELKMDYYLEAWTLFKTEFNLILFLAGGYTPAANFSPAWTVQGEVGYGFKFGLEIYLKYWRIQFKNGGAHVISPALVYNLKRWVFTVRYYLGIDDKKGIGHAGMLKVSCNVTSPLSIYLGGAVGNRAEYIEPFENESELFYSLFIGAVGKITWRHQLTFDYTFRVDQTSSRLYRQHKFTLGYQVAF